MALMPGILSVDFWVVMNILWVFWPQTIAVLGLGILPSFGTTETWQYSLKPPQFYEQLIPGVDRRPRKLHGALEISRLLGEYVMIFKMLPSPGTKWRYAYIHAFRDDPKIQVNNNTWEHMRMCDLKEDNMARLDSEEKIAKHAFSTPTIQLS
ncbi:hypothetical protein B0H11DRAFT_2203460 [Mycena galericulata]|nr:hypothetical protein B0H11DRAFT_2203460 [Mycena galericulata]